MEHKNARSDSTDVKAAKLRSEEAVRDADRIAAHARSLFERVDVTPLCSRRENPIAAEEIRRPVLDARQTGTNVANVAAQAGKVLRKDNRLAARRSNAVRIVING